MRDRLHVAAPYISLFGLILLVASPLIRTVQDLPENVAPALAIIGALLTLAWPVLRPDELRAAIGARQVRYGGNALVLVVAVIGILALLNFLGTRRYWVWDLTENQRYSISRQTVQVLNDLTEPVQLTAVLSDPAIERDLEQLVEKYQARSDKITFRTIDPNAQPVDTIGLFQRIGEERPLGRVLVAEQGPKSTLAYTFDEQAVTEAIVKVTRDEEKTLVFTTGHGENSAAGASLDESTYAGMSAALEREGYTVETVNLATTPDALDSAAAVIVAGPRNPFQPDEAELLADYVSEGGALMALLDPMAEHGLDPILEPWDLRVRDDIVLDPARAFLGDPSLLGVQADGYRFHTVTKDLETIVSVFPRARSIETGTPITTALTTTPLIETSDQAWGESNLEALVAAEPSFAQDPEDAAGPLTLAVAAEGGEEDGRLVVFGTSMMATDSFLGSFQGTANADLFLNAVNWLTLEEDLIGIRPTEPDDRPITQPQNKDLLTLASALLAPLAVAAVGAWVWMQRRG